MLARIAHRVHLSIMATIAAAVVAACASSPVSIAETPQQKFYAAKLTYDAVLSGALVLVNDTTLPAELRRRIQSAAASSGDAYRASNQAYLQYVAARAELAAGQTTSEKLEIASANLLRWLGELEAAAAALAAVTQS